jgi:hypothetical protein
MSSAHLKLLVCGAVALSTAALSPTASSAQSPPAPNVLCAWLVARDDAGAIMTDDDPTIAENTTGALRADGNRPSQPAASTEVAVHIRPNGIGDAAARVVEFWTALDDPAGIGNIAAVAVDVTGPDGTTAHHTGVTETSPCSEAEAAAASAATPDIVDGGTGQLGPGVASNGLGTGLIDLCFQQGLAVYKIPFEVPGHWPCGTYTATVDAVGRHSSATSAPSAVRFEVICFSQVEIDISDISFGDLRPGQVSQLVGDNDFDPTSSRSSEDHPTLRNTGNSAVALSLAFTPMTDGHGHSVHHFAARFGTDANSARAFTLGGSTVLTSSVTVDLPGGVDAAGQGTALCPGSTGRLDLAARPAADLVVGDYRGSVSVMTRPFSGCHPRAAGTAP